jgi:large subunit ribosomal protein L29
MKAKEIRELTAEELNLRIEQARKELFNLRMQQASAQLEKPSRIRELRRDVARLQTIQTERENKAS